MGILKKVPGDMKGNMEGTSLNGPSKQMIDNGMNSRPTAGMTDLKSTAPTNQHTLDRKPRPDFLK